MKNVGSVSAAECVCGSQKEVITSASGVKSCASCSEMGTILILFMTLLFILVLSIHIRNKKNDTIFLLNMGEKYALAKRFCLTLFLYRCCFEKIWLL